MGCKESNCFNNHEDMNMLQQPAEYIDFKKYYRTNPELHFDKNEELAKLVLRRNSWPNNQQVDSAWNEYRECHYLNNSIDMEYAILNLRSTDELYFQYRNSFESEDYNFKGKAYGFNIVDSLEDEVTYISIVSEEVSRKISSESENRQRKSSALTDQNNTENKSLENKSTLLLSSKFSDSNNKSGHFGNTIPSYQNELDLAKLNDTLGDLAEVLNSEDKEEVVLSDADYINIEIKSDAERRRSTLEDMDIKSKRNSDVTTFTAEFQKSEEKQKESKMSKQPLEEEVDELIEEFDDVDFIEVKTKPRASSLMKDDEFEQLK